MNNNVDPRVMHAEFTPDPHSIHTGSTPCGCSCAALQCHSSLKMVHVNGVQSSWTWSSDFTSQVWTGHSWRVRV
eukprot:359547-Chlamydomonas_euryale.AAC.2